MQVLSQQLISDEYARLLREDLRSGTLVRFLVAYTTDQGLDTIGRTMLLNRLKHSESFGIASISCSCGYEALLNLQSELSDQRLKYFMDPDVGDTCEPFRIALLHSKVVYIADVAREKSIVYVGSHNWTARALGSASPRNAELSLRFEEPFRAEHLAGSPESIAGQINRHLRSAYNLPLCLPATKANEPRFIEWKQNACTPAKTPPLDETVVILAVVDPACHPLSIRDWESLVGSTVYVQILEEEDGQLLWNARRDVYLWVWESVAAFGESKPQFILRCRITANNAGEKSQLQGRNEAPSPIEGFRSVVMRHTVDQLRSGRTATPATYQTHSGRLACLYHFVHPTQSNRSEEYDRLAEPLYQYCLVVNLVAIPSDRVALASQWPRFVWRPETLAVASRPSMAPVMRSPGYRVTPEEESRMLACLGSFGVDVEARGVFPYSEFDENLIGKRLSSHPLHETYLDLDDQAALRGVYARARKGALVPKATSRKEQQGFLFPGAEYPTPLKGIHKVYMNDAEALERLWECYRES